MRISESEKNKIISSIESILDIKNAKLFLYGSRTNNNLKGGDIDLLLIFEDNTLYKLANEKKYEILIEIKSKIGDQKIDLLLAHTSEIDKNAFLDMIFNECQLINSW